MTVECGRIQTQVFTQLAQRSTARQQRTQSRNIAIVGTPLDDRSVFYKWQRGCILLLEQFEHQIRSSSCETRQSIETVHDRLLLMVRLGAQVNSGASRRKHDPR